METSTSTQKQEVPVEEAVACRHQWIIATPDGPSSKGICRQCGGEREFMNYIEGSTWGYDVSLDHLAGGTRFPTNVDRRPAKLLADDEDLN